MLDHAALANAVLDVYWSSLVRTTFSNRFCVDLDSTPYAPEAAGVEDGPEANLPRGLFRIEPPEGGLSDKMSVETSTTHAATDLTEYGAPGAAGKDTIVNAEPGTVSKIIPVGITGFSLDDCKGTADRLKMITQHFRSAFKRLGDSINLAFLGTGVSSLYGALDSTTVYAGLDPAVYTQWAAYEDTTGGILSEAILENLWYEVTGGNRNAREDDLVWLFPANQIKRYRAMGRMIGVGAAVQKVVRADGGILDMGFSGLAYNERPIIRVPDGPTTEILLHNTSEAFIKEKRSVQVVVKPYSGDGELFHITWRGKLMYPNKHQGGKASGLTA